MAHDRQVEPPQEPSNGSSTPTDRASGSLEVLRDWWAVFGQIYRDDPTELLAVAFRETLKNLPAQVLHEACLRAQRESPQFRPTPGRVYEIAENLLAQNQTGNRPKYLDEPKMSREEREQALKDFPLKLGGEVKINYASMEKLGFGMPHAHDPHCLCQACRERRNGQQ